MLNIWLRSFDVAAWSKTCNVCLRVIWRTSRKEEKTWAGDNVRGSDWLGPFTKTLPFICSMIRYRQSILVSGRRFLIRLEICFRNLVRVNFGLDIQYSHEKVSFVSYMYIIFILRFFSDLLQNSWTKQIFKPICVNTKFCNFKLWT